MFFDQWAKVKTGGSGKCASTNKNSVFDIVQQHGMQSVWNSTLTVTVPTTVFKMRGQGTDQPTKMGELQLETIDHIFYTGAGLTLSGVNVFHKDHPLANWSKCFDREKDKPNALKEGFLRGSLDENLQACFMYMMPSLTFPSDHWPVLATFTLT